MWELIGYNPNSARNNDDLTGVDIPQQIGGKFTPRKVESEADRFKGVVVRNFPKDTDHGLIMEYLVQNGMPEKNREYVTFASNGSATVRNLNKEECINLIESIHSKSSFGRILHCNGLIPLTPNKNETEGVAQVHSSEPCSSPENRLSIPSIQLTSPASLPDLSKRFHESIEESDELLVRRHSLSLLNRTPPPKSIAADILGLNGQKAASLVRSSNNILRSIQETLSDFGSEVASDFNTCNSAISSSSSEENHEDSSAQKSKKKRKKKAKRDYNREDFVKKANNQVSPASK